MSVWRILRTVLCTAVVYNQSTPVLTSQLGPVSIGCLHVFFSYLGSVCLRVCLWHIKYIFVGYCDCKFGYQ